MRWADRHAPVENVKQASTQVVLFRALALAARAQAPEQADM